MVAVGSAICGGGIGCNTIGLDALSSEPDGKVSIALVFLLNRATKGGGVEPVKDTESVEDTISHEEDDESESY